MSEARLLKKDLFGEVWQRTSGDGLIIVRDTRPAPLWTRWLARMLLRRELRALALLEGIDGVPALQHFDKHTLARSFLRGAPLHVSRPADARYFDQAARLLRRLHGRGVTHNDLAKEPNLLVAPDGAPAFIDFQLAAYSRRRGRLFRAAAREDIRHLLKHKRTCFPDALTARERAILDNPSPVSRAYMRFVKPVYLFVTRRLLRWSDREGAGDRGAAK
ncbi:MAG: serine/threonine protein kinase [Gammaproteobacteria bacterium]|nr:serine/threonine protein kinase [Gammaproteobacteria bacterium]